MSRTSSVTEVGWTRAASLFGALVLLVVGASGAAQSQDADAGVVIDHAPTLEDMRQIRVFAELAVSADGQWVAYTMSRPYGTGTTTSSEMAHGRITLLDARSHRTRVVSVSGRPHSMRWSPVGHSLAFLTQSDAESRLWVCGPTDGITTPRSVTRRDSLDGVILAFAWSPTGDELAYIAAEPAVSDRAADSSETRPGLVIFHDAPGDYTGPTSPLYSRDSTGTYVAVMRMHDGAVHVLARHIVSSRYGPTVDWSRPGMLLVSGAPIGVRWFDQLAVRRLYTLDPLSRAVHRVHPEPQARLQPVWSPSGRWIASVDFQAFPEGRPSSYTLRLDAPARNEAIILSRDRDDPSSVLLTPRWSGDDRTLYVVQAVEATTRLFSIDVRRRRWRAITPETLSVAQYAVSQDGTTLAAVLESARQPQEIFRIDPATGALTRLTYESRALPPMRIGQVEQVTWRSGDDRFTVHGFLVEPPGFDSTRRYPLVVMVHGGPGALYMNAFMSINFPHAPIPSQLLAAAGYLVLLPNPRGDPGYGVPFMAALHGASGTGAFTDINAGVSALIARGFVDSSAIGIAGASYGGYVTAYAITQTRRFAAASINDAPVDLTSEYGQNYATRSLWSSYFGGTPWSAPELYRSQSPITFIRQVRTPVLMRYGGRSDTGDDIRQAYMLAQGFELYAALRDLGVPVQFVLHPDQGHGIADWELYTDWVTRNLCWFDYWLRHEGPNPIEGIH